MKRKNSVVLVDKIFPNHLLLTYLQITNRKVCNKTEIAFSIQGCAKAFKINKNGKKTVGPENSAVTNRAN